MRGQFHCRRAWHARRALPPTAPANEVRGGQEGGGGRDREVRSLVDLAGADADDAFDGQDEDLAVADFAGVRGGANGVDGQVHEGVRDADLQSPLDQLLFTVVPR